MKQTLLSVAVALVGVVSVHASELPKALVDPYLQVQAALAADSVDGVAAQAAAIERAAAALGKDAEKLVEGAKRLAAAKDLAAARTAFGDVSDALVAYADKTRSELGPAVRVAYCPMVNKSWLQKDKEIRNPYYGSSMLTCGSFRTK